MQLALLTEKIPTLNNDFLYSFRSSKPLQKFLSICPPPFDTHKTQDSTMPTISFRYLHPSLQHSITSPIHDTLSSLRDSHVLHIFPHGEDKL